MREPAAKKAWSSSEAYEAYIGRWSRLVAAEFLVWLRLPHGLDWLDVGCGTGALTQVVVQACAPRRVLGIDVSEEDVAYARARLKDARAEFRVGDAQALPVPDGSFDAVVSGLMLNFVPNQAQAAAEMRRAARPGATIAAYVWDFADRMQLMRHFWDAAAAIDPTARELDYGLRFPTARPEPMAELFASAGLHGVTTRAVDVPTVFRDFEDYWAPLLSGHGSVPGYCMSLSEARRAVLRDRLRAKLPTRSDGSIHLIARAWAVRGLVPG